MGVNKSRSSTLPSSSSTTQSLLTWSARLKHSGIIMKERTITRIAEGRNRYGNLGISCLTSGIVDLSSINKWSVQIKAFKNGMTIGICQIRSAQ